MIRVKAGARVITDRRVEAGRVFEALIPCEWEAAEFRLPGVADDGFALPALAVNVEVTGKAVRMDVPRLVGTPVVRARVTFVGDCEADTTVGGWVLAEDVA